MYLQANYTYELHSETAEEVVYQAGRANRLHEYKFVDDEFQISHKKIERVNMKDTNIQHEFFKCS